MKSHLKTAFTEVNNHINVDTGEIVETNVKRHTYIADSKEQFLILYVNALPVFRDVSNPAKSVYAYLLEYYTAHSLFEIGGGLRSLMAKKLGFGTSTIANALTELTSVGLLYSPSKALYQINPRYAFKGSTSERNSALKAIIELGCKNC